MILLCTADNNYIEKYKPCIDSQKDWCKKNNYTYTLVSGTRESCNWKREKINKLMYLLDTTDEDVCLIDGDCYIKENCPSINFLNSKKSIYYANGKSERLNSGFLYYKNNSYSKKFVKELLEKLNNPIPRGKGYFVTTEGENGHIIWIQNEWINNGLDIFQKISRYWNCSSPKLKELAYILHFTNDLRKEIRKYNEEYFRSS
jgi:hypothetical protein